MDRDGVIGSRDLEEKVNSMLDQPVQYQSTCLSNRSANKTQSLANQNNLERIALKRTLGERLGESALSGLLKECRKKFDKFDSEGEGSIEYDKLIALLTETYEFFGIAFKPSSQDTRRYIEVIDSDKDGLICWQDFEMFLMKVISSIDQQSQTEAGQQ